MNTITAPVKPQAIEAELSLLPPEPIEAPAIPEPEPPATPWFEDLDNHPEHRPPGNAWRRAPDGVFWQQGDLRQGMTWHAIEPDPGNPGMWRRSKRPPLAYDPHRGCRSGKPGWPW